jgi:gliding motility-associated lipoprotein GldH
MKKVIYFSLVWAILSACTGSSDIKEIRDFKGNEWEIAKKVTFTFKIADTLKTYNFNYLLRNSISYPYYNIYLNQSLVGPDGKVLSASMDEIILFNEKTGKPYGDGIGDIFDNRVAAPKLTNFKLKKAGTYKWTISHNMRPDPLTGIMSLGIEVLGTP